MGTTPPIWNDPASPHGTMVRGALWLLQVVGEGGTFSKNELREAFPGIAQADRRIRDLRKYDWVLHSSIEDASLAAENQRFVKAGLAVWDQNERRKFTPSRVMSARDRQIVLARDGFMCTLCGISAAEPYPDDPVMTGVLAISRRVLRTPDGLETECLVTECKRCRSGRGDAVIDLHTAMQAAKELDTFERRRFLQWIERGRRGTTALDRAWTAYLQIPFEGRDVFLREVATER